MRSILRLFTIAAIACALSAGGVRAEEKNGLLVSVTKKTLERNDGRTVSSTRVDRTQGLNVSIKNTSIKDFPVGEVQWTLVVRKYSGGLERYSGKEVLKALRPSMTTEVLVGAAQTGGYRSDYVNYKDKLEYEVIIVHNGKETLRATSDQNFALLAKRATNMDRREDAEDTEPAKPGELIPGKPTAGIIPKPAIPTIPVRPELPPGMVPPGTTPGTMPPGTVPPGALPPTPPMTPIPGQTADGKPVEPKPGEPAAEPPVAEQPPGKPFDFFNLDRKK